LTELPRISRTPGEETIFDGRSWERSPKQSARSTQGLRAWPRRQCRGQAPFGGTRGGAPPLPLSSDSMVLRQLRLLIVEAFEESDNVIALSRIDHEERMRGISSPLGVEQL